MLSWCLNQQSKKYFENKTIGDSISWSSESGDSIHRKEALSKKSLEKQQERKRVQRSQKLMLFRCVFWFSLCFSSTIFHSNDGVSKSRNSNSYTSTALIERKVWVAWKWVSGNTEFTESWLSFPAFQVWICLSSLWKRLHHNHDHRKTGLPLHLY